jgi:hypothetical protein
LITRSVSIDDRVVVEKTEVDPADRVIVALPQNLRVRGDLTVQLRDHLVDQAVTAGRTVACPIGFDMFSGRFSRRIPLTVVGTRPSGTVVVQPPTDSEIADRSAKEVSVEPGDRTAYRYVRATARGEASSVDEIELTMTHFERALDEIDANARSEGWEFEETAEAM